MCADICKDAQRKKIMAHHEAVCKRFLLLCNIYVVNNNYILINNIICNLPPIG